MIRSFLPRVLVGAGIVFAAVMLVLAGLSVANPLQAAAFISGGLALGGISAAVGFGLESLMTMEQAVVSTNAQTTAIANMTAARHGA